jgi:transcriptional regulator with XRE-family HTH domain
VRRSEEKTRLAVARVAAGITQEQLEEITWVSIDQIRHFERGARPLTPEMASTFSHALGISAAWLLGYGESEEPIGLDGQPYSLALFDLAPLRLISDQDPKAEQKKAQFQKIVRKRAKAWEIYLTSLLSEYVLRIRDSEEIGCILSVLITRRMEEAGIKPKYASVDDVMRQEAS